jgi:hypothetical protein
MPVPVGLNVWSRLVESLIPYLDQSVGPFESLWFPDHVQYGANKVAEGWTLLAFGSRYPDKPAPTKCSAMLPQSGAPGQDGDGAGTVGNASDPGHRRRLEREEMHTSEAGPPADAFASPNSARP